MAEFLVRPLVAAGVEVYRWVAAWVRALTAALLVFVLSMLVSAPADDLLIGYVGVAPETYGLLFNGWLALTLLAMGVVGRAQLER